MSETLLHLSDAEFETKVLKSTSPFLVDFWAEWCGPCRALTPVMEALAKDYQGRVQIGKMNIDENPQTPTTYAVRAIPTLILFKGGKPVDQVVGLVSKTKLDDMLKRHM